MQYHGYLPFQSTLRHLSDGLLNGKGEDIALYIGFDLSITTNPVVDQRDVRVGVHFLKFGYRVLGAADRNFLMSAFNVDAPWESVSTHDSCWADSFDGYVNDIVRDVMKNKENSRFVKPYEDDGLVFVSDFSFSTSLFLSGVSLVSKNDLVNVRYVDRHNGDCVRNLV